MAEDRKALLRQEASRRAFVREEKSQTLKAIERAGIVLLPGSAAFKELMSVLKTYSDETGQPFQTLLSDPVQMEAILRGQDAVQQGASKPMTYEAHMKEAEKRADYRGSVRETREEALVRASRNTQTKSFRAPRAQRALDDAREKAARVVKYSEGGQSPRLASYADQVRLAKGDWVPTKKLKVGMARGTSRRFGPQSEAAQKAWKANVDPKFLDRLSFVHWTQYPETLAGAVRGIPATADALSASAYLQGEAGGVGFSFNRWDQGDFGFILEGDVTWMANQDAMTGGGEPSPRHTATLDPILDEETYVSNRKRVDLEQHRRYSTRKPPGYGELWGVSEDVDWAHEGNNINEALIEKSRVRGIVVDPKSHRRPDGRLLKKGVQFPLDVETAARLRPGGVAEKLGKASILAEEMGIPLFGPDGGVLYTPPNMPEEEVARVARNFPTAEKIQAISPEELASGKRWAKTPHLGGMYRGLQVRHRILKKLTDEIRLHEVPEYEAVHDPRETLHGRDYGEGSPRRKTPLTSAEELEDAVEHIRGRPDFRVGHLDSYNELNPKFEPHTVGGKGIELDVEPRLTPSAPPKVQAPTEVPEWRVRDEIQEAEEHLAKAVPGSVESRAAASKLATAKKALKGLGKLAGIAGTAYEVGRFGGEVGRHGPLEGTKRYAGTLGKEIGGLVQLPEKAAEMLPGYGEKGVNIPAMILGAGGRKLSAAGRSLRGEDAPYEAGKAIAEAQARGESSSLDDSAIGQEIDREVEQAMADEKALQAGPRRGYNPQMVRGESAWGAPGSVREETRAASHRALLSQANKKKEAL